MNVLKKEKSHMKFVFIGAGSSVFTLRLIGDILGESCIGSGELVLIDLDEKVLRETEEAVKQFIKHVGRDFSVEAYVDLKKEYQMRILYL